LSATLRSASVICARVNPVFAASTVYVLGGSKGIVNVPDAFVRGSHVNPVPLLVAVPWDARNTALFGSVTVPLRVAVED